MTFRIPLTAALAAAGLTVATHGVAAAQGPLRIAAVDVEGGAATLFVTPEGQSLLVDTGWPPGMGDPRPAPGAPATPRPSSAERIVAQARAMGLSKIDYVLTTHYHTDHIGGLDDLLGRFPVGAFVDHGPNRQETPPNTPPERLATASATFYAQYEKSVAGKKRIVMKPGDTLKIGGMTLTAVDSDREVLAKPLPGAGKPNPACAGLPTAKQNVGGEENPRSLGFVATYGKARILALGDTTWDVEHKLACPVGLIGPVDLMLMTHHGSNLSGNPALIASVTPTVVVTPNGATKGGDPEVFDALKAQPGLKDVWQLHTAEKAPDKNPPAELIANLTGTPDDHHPLLMSVDVSGAVTVTNPRNKVSKTYPKAAR